MITNFGQNVKFFCMNKHPVPIEMKIKEGNNQFYACPKFMMKDDEHPDGYAPGVEVACNNRLSFDDAGDIIMKFSEMVSEAMLNGEMVDWKNYTFKVKQITVKVLKYSDSGTIWLGVVNRRVAK